MNANEKWEYIHFRLESSRKTFEAARILAECGYWNSAVNRLYYALFYSVSALLFFYDIPAKKHSTIKSQFSLHFVKTGKFDKKYGQLLSELFDWRQKGDYDNIFLIMMRSQYSLFLSLLKK